MGPADRELERDVRTIMGQLTLITIVFFLMLAFQSFQLIRDRTTLVAVLAQQEPGMQQSLKLRQQLNGVASGITKLADDGDADARAIIDDMRRQGIAVRNLQDTPPR